MRKRSSGEQIICPELASISLKDLAGFADTILGVDEHEGSFGFCVDLQKFSDCVGDVHLRKDDPQIDAVALGVEEYKWVAVISRDLIGAATMAVVNKKAAHPPSPGMLIDRSVVIGRCRRFPDVQAEGVESTGDIDGIRTEASAAEVGCGVMQISRIYEVGESNVGNIS